MPRSSRRLRAAPTVPRRTGAGSSRLAGDHLELRLTIGAKTDEGKLKFLKALEDSHEFSDIEVLGENRIGGRSGDDQVMMALNARYSAS